MATPYHAQAVKSLNNSSSGRRRFVFKTFSQRIEEIDIDVYRSLDPLKAEPSEDSSFFRDCLIEYRELNTSRDFMSLYEEIFPLVQRYEQVVLQKDLIISSLLSRLKMEGRLSHEPILRLLAALSRDILKDFVPFLPRIVDSVEHLLQSGADRDPEIIEQIFITWSYITMYLQKYLIEDIGYILRISSKLRYYHRDYVREFMAESISFLLRKAPAHQLKKGLMNLMTEVVEEPSEIRLSGAGALLSHVIRISSSKLHSRAGVVMPLFWDESLFEIDDKNVGDSNSVLRVLSLAFERLHEELDPSERKLIWKCLCKEIKLCAEENCTRLCHLLTMLISVVRNDYPGKISDYEPVVELVGLLLQSFVVPCVSTKSLDQESAVIDKVLQIMLCTIRGLSGSKDVSALPSVSSKWEAVFNLRSRSLLTLIENILKDSNILHYFGLNIMRAFNNLIDTFTEEVLQLMADFCEKVEENNFGFFDLRSVENISKIHKFFEETIHDWIGNFSDAVKENLFPVPFQQNKLAILWGVISCYPHYVHAQSNPSLLMNLIYAMEQLLVVESGLPEGTWHSLIGVALRAYHKSVSTQNVVIDESTMTRFFDLAKRYKTSPQILSAVAYILDSISASTTLPDTGGQFYLSESVAGKVLDALDIFAENLCHANKDIRLSTLRILCHYKSLHYGLPMKDLPAEDDMSEDVSISHAHEPHDNNVLNLLKSIEETSLSVATSRKVTLLISKIQMSLTANRTAEQYIPVTLYGIIGIFHNRFSYLWNPASECLGILIGRYFRIVWDRYAKYLDHYQSFFLTSGQHGQAADNIDKDTGLLGRFNFDTVSHFDSTPCPSVLSLLIQSLQKVSTLAESHSQKIVPLFLKFLGCNDDDSTSYVAPHTLERKGKEWTGVLKEWLSFLRLFRNPKAIYQSDLLRNILQYRLLDQNDADLQMMVLDCLLNWREDYLVPYSDNLKNLIDAKHLREELARWSLSKVDVQHRSYVIPIVIRILIPKVRNLKMLASQKNTSVSHRKAILAFLVQLDVDELHLFFRLLLEPLFSSLQRDKELGKGTCSLTGSPEDEVDTSSILKHFTADDVKGLSSKQKYGFLHVFEDILAVFDEFHLNPFLEPLMNCVIRILASCTSSRGSSSHGPSIEQKCSGPDLDVSNCELENQIPEKMSVKQFKDLRSLCLKIIYVVLIKYDTHEFGDKFWDLFFASVKPLLVNFKQEGASSEKPSSLFNCFLAMTKSYKLVPLLLKETHLVPDIFSMLAVPSASDSIISGVLKFAKNLLKLDNELGVEDDSVKKILLPHIDVLICSLHGAFTSRNAARRQLVKLPGKMELTIFSLLAKYVREPLIAERFIDILLPLLIKRRQNNDTCVAAMQIICQLVTVLGTSASKKILSSVSPLLISSDTAVRCSICDVLDALATKDPMLLPLANILRELNGTMEMEIDGLDYDGILQAYDKINVGFFHSVPEEHALLILAHSIHDMSSTELILRQSAVRLLVSYVEFSSQILSGSLNTNHMWSRESVLKIVKKFLLQNMGYAMDKENAVRKVWLDLLREMVLRIPEVENLGSYRALCSDDVEQDFFHNIVHIQKHRRARAVSRFRSALCSGNLSEVVINKVFVPLLFSMLFNVQDGKDEHIRSSCLDALASISGRMEWNRYRTLLIRCFRDLKLKPEKQKVLIRLICAILGNFNFLEAFVSEDNISSTDAPDPYATCKTSALTTRNCAMSEEIPAIQAFLRDNLLPKIRKLMDDSDNVHANISVVALKLLKYLTREYLELQLPNIIQRISNFLKNRLESVRDEARSALAACLDELGLGYLQFIVKILKGTLKRGYELHVLGYTLNFILSKFLVNPKCGRLDYCLDDLLSVVVSDILGDVSNEKEVEKIASKMKETRKQKSYETLKLIAQSTNFKSHALKLLSPITVHLNGQLTQKVKSKLEKMLNHIAAGIECNPSVELTELFVFLNCLIRDGMLDEEPENGDGYVSRKSRPNGQDENDRAAPKSRLLNVDQQFSHLITAFALGILHSYLKRESRNEQLLSLSDPFVVILTQCLSSKYESIITASIGCLSMLVRLPLPSFVSQADKIKNSLLVIAQSSGNARNQLIESCVKLLTMLLRSTKVTLSADQLHMLIQFPMFIDFAKNPSFVALSLLKAIIHRKLVVPEIYDLIQIVAELMVQSQHETIRKKCNEILLQFLLGYHLSEKRLQQHLDFLLANLRYEHASGRQAVLEMLHAIILRFPQNIVDDQSQTMFVHLVVTLANDDDSNVRKMVGVALKRLIGRVSAHSLQATLEYSLSWYLSQKQNLWAAAAQVLGLLVEVMEKRFEKHLKEVLPVMKRIVQSAVASCKSSNQNMSEGSIILFWKEAYQSLFVFEKILYQFPNLFFDADMEDVWEAICTFLLHPHYLMRDISNQLLSLYFNAVGEACKEKSEGSIGAYFLTKPSMLFLAASSLCRQLNVPSIDKDAVEIFMQNLVSSICGLQSLFMKNENGDVSQFWSNLDATEQEHFIKAFGILDSRKGRRILESFTSSDDASAQQHNNQHHHSFISFLLQTMGKISLHMEDTQMKMVFDCFKLIAPKLLSKETFLPSCKDDLQCYAYQMLLPLYRVSEGYSGKVVSDALKEVAREVSETISGVIGRESYINVTHQIQKNLKVKRDKRKREEKIMAVVNPTRNAKRKLRMASKHRAHKKRKIMTMKMGRWMR